MPFGSAPISVKKGKTRRFNESPRLLAVCKTGHNPGTSHLECSRSWILGSMVNCGLTFLIRTGMLTVNARDYGHDQNTQRPQSQERTDRKPNQKDSAPNPGACCMSVPLFGAVPHWALLPCLSARLRFAGRPLVSASGRKEIRKT